MPSQYIRALGVVVGLAAVLSMASISADQPSDEQASRQIERQLSKNEAFRDVTIWVQEHVAFLNGAVPTLEAREQAIDEARTVQGVQGVISHLMIGRASRSSKAPRREQPASGTGGAQPTPLRQGPRTLRPTHHDFS